MNTLITDNKINALHWARSILTNLNWKRTHVIQIKQYCKKRSLAQNRTYWMILQCIADHIGEDKECVHDAYKRKYLPWKEKELPGGLSYLEVASTPDLDSKEFTEYLDKIYRHAQDFLNITLPKPGDAGFNAFCEEYEKYSHI